VVGNEREAYWALSIVIGLLFVALFIYIGYDVVTKGASLESERTTAVLGRTGVMEFNPYAILDFLPISPGAFTELHLRFGESLEKKPRIFSVNYFLKDENGNFLTGKRDKYVWLKWMELRVHGDVDAIETPTGYIPIYTDLEKLFDKWLGKEFKEDLYEKLFTIRIAKLLEKTERILKIYSSILDTPQKLFTILQEQKKRLKEAEWRYGTTVNPFKLDKK